jgi:hypothetical protein
VEDYALKVAGPFEKEEDLLQELLGDVLGARDLPDVDRTALRVPQGELEHGPAGVFALGRESHLIQLSSGLIY